MLECAMEFDKTRKRDKIKMRSDIM